jgi:hypothetical protein
MICPQIFDTHSGSQEEGSQTMRQFFFHEVQPTVISLHFTSHAAAHKSSHVFQPLNSNSYISHQVIQGTMQRKRSTVLIKLNEEICTKQNRKSKY